MPTLFWTWALLPSASSIVIAFLVLATLATLCVVPVTAGVARTPLVVPAATALAAYFVYFPVQLPVFSQEAWAVCFGLGSLAAFALSLRSEHWRAFVVASVALAVIGTLIRETLVFLPIAGAASAFVGSERRPFRVAAWIAGLVAIAASYTAHYVAAKPYISASSGPSQFSRGGLGNVVAAVTYATDMLGGPGVLAVALAVLGLAGAVLLPDRSMRVFALVATLAPLVAFLFVANRAWYETTGERINYWGATVVPFLYALIPAGLTLLPCAAVRTSDTVRPDKTSPRARVTSKPRVEGS